MDKAPMTRNQRDPAAAFNRFRPIVRDALGDLLRDYLFEEIEAHVLDPGMWIIFRNERTQLEVNFEYGVGVWLSVRRLSTSRGKTGPVEGYSLDEILLLRSPDKARHVQMRAFNEKAIRDVLRDGGEALRQHADDILRGDFAVFDELARLRAARTHFDPLQS